MTRLRIILYNAVRQAIRQRLPIERQARLAARYFELRHAGGKL